MTAQTWRLRRTTQCDKCPWRTVTNPHDIPHGYSVARHKALSRTIAKPGDLSSLLCETQHVMACHETHDAYCLGWLAHQVGPGNNIPLRIAMLSCENRQDIRLRGAQHERFEDTLPQQQRTGRR